MLLPDFIERERILSDFLHLVQIDSPTGHESEIGQVLMARLQLLGGNIHQDAVGNILARYAGRGSDEVLLLSAHMDTVGTDRDIKPIVRDGVVYSEGATILGADDKSGLAVLLEVLGVLAQHHDLLHPALEIVITVGEERGLWGARQFDKSQLSAHWGVVLDAGGPIGTLVYAAPSQDRLEVIVHGRKAHAGSEPEKGINAILVAAHALTRMPLGRIDEETTANVGVIHGGEATNIVPDHVSMLLEARSRNAAKLDAQTAAMVQVLNETAENHGVQVDVKVERLYHSYTISPDQRPYQAAERALRSLGFEVRPRQAGGGTDGNIYTNAGIPCIVLSTGMTNVHTPDESVAIQDMIDAARVLLALLLQVGEEVKA